MEAWRSLRGAGFLHAVRDAHREATLRVFEGMDRAEGFTERSFGVGAFDVLASRLDAVLGLGGEGPAVAGAVRDDLNQSPGWRVGRYRMLLKRHTFGQVRRLRWDRDSPTKQAVARQAYADDAQLALPLGLPPGVSTADTPGIVTLVLAHSATDEPLDMELYLGRPRWNADGGDAWHWVRRLDDRALGADPRRKLDEATLPLWSDGSADVPMRRRRETSTETT